MAIKAKSYNALMRHLRHDCGVAIEGQTAKRKLRTIGYYHGYKGYRFSKTGRSRLPISDFSEIEQLYLFDMRLKSILYPWMMRVETALKNCVLEAITEKLQKSGSGASYDDVCRICFTDIGAKARHAELSYLAKKISMETKHEPVGHYTANSRDVPIWVLFEVLTLGEFGQLYACLSNDIKSNVYSSLGMPPRTWNAANARPADSEDFFLALLNAFKELRNSIAHNNVIVDARFSVRNMPKGVTGDYLGSQFGLQRIKFNELVDYALTTVFFMGALRFPKTDQKQLIASLERALAEYRGKLPPKIFDAMVGKSYPLKLKAARRFVKNQ